MPLEPMLVRMKAICFFLTSNKTDWIDFAAMARSAGIEDPSREKNFVRRESIVPDLWSMSIHRKILYMICIIREYGRFQKNYFLFLKYCNYLFLKFLILLLKNIFLKIKARFRIPPHPPEFFPKNSPPQSRSAIGFSG